MITKVFFWQNVNSIHQSAFFNSLVLNKNLKVYLICSELLADERMKMGWNAPTLSDSVNFIESTDERLLKGLVDKNKNDACLHIFSGISAFKYVHKIFKYAITQKCRIGVLSEPLDFRGIKGTLRKIRGIFHRILYEKHICLILAIGDKAIKQFEFWGYRKSKIFLWSYCVEKSTNELNLEPQNSNIFKIIYCGSLYSWKGYDILIKALDSLNLTNNIAITDFYSYHKSNINSVTQKVISDNSKKLYINILPFVSNQEIRCCMREYDLLVLPSRYDGWGAVVNEALMEGLPVLVSPNCGVVCLFNENSAYCGEVIVDFSIESLKVMLERKVSEGNISINRRMVVKEWANSNISGEALSNYFYEILNYCNDANQIEKELPIAPWLRYN